MLNSNTHTSISGYDSKNYGSLLQHFDLAYEKQGPYYCSPNIPEKSGWILHLSFVEPHVILGIKAVLKVLSRKNIYWKLVHDKESATAILNGKAGIELVGKVLSIYVANDDELLPITEELISITATLKGPFVPTDAYLGGCVYTRYGGYVTRVGVDKAGNKFPIRRNQEGKWEKDPKPIPFQLNVENTWPFKTKIITYPQVWIPEGYRYVKTLSDHVKGSVYLISKEHSTGPDALFVLKQGRKYMWYDDNGKDMTERIRRQLDMNLRINKHCRVPQIIESYTHEGNEYLFYKYLEGELLSDKIKVVHRQGLPWKEIKEEDKNKLWDVYIQICKAVNWLHQQNILHRDISPANFLIDSNNSCWMIDFEMEFLTNENKSGLNNIFGTPGFLSESQISNYPPTREDDYYSLGATLFYLCTGIYPTKVDLFDSENRMELLSIAGVSNWESLNISRLLSNNYSDRNAAFNEIVKQENLIQNSISSKLELPLVHFKLKTSELLPDFVQKAVEALSTNIYRKSEGCWQYMGHGKGAGVGVRRSLWDGLAGTLYMIGEVNRMGYNFDKLQPMVGKAAENIYQTSRDCNYQEPAGLLTGLAGYILGISAISDDSKFEYLRSQIEELIMNMPDEISSIEIGSGTSGIGLALILAHSAGHSNAWNKLTTIHNLIIQSNLEDHISIEPDTFGFFGNITGVLFFQVSACNVIKDPYSFNIVQRRMHMWQNNFSHFIHRLKKAGGINVTDENSMERILWGVQLCLIYYRMSGENSFLSTAEDVLGIFPRELVTDNWTVYNGLSILGHTYLDAWEVTKKETYHDNAVWIANVLMKMARYKNDLPYWSIGQDPPSPEYLGGTAGIIHFLARTSSGQKGCSPFQVKYRPILKTIT